MDNIWGILKFIFGIVFILVGAYVTTRFIAARSVHIGHGKYFRIIDRIILGNNKSLCIIQAGQNYYIISLSQQNIELIDKIDESTLIPINLQPEATFSGLLDKYFHSKKKSDNIHEDSILNETKILSSIKLDIKRLRDKLDKNHIKQNKE